MIFVIKCNKGMNYIHDYLVRHPKESARYSVFSDFFYAYLEKK